MDISWHMTRKRCRSCSALQWHQFNYFSFSVVFNSQLLFLFVWFLSCLFPAGILRNLYLLIGVWSRWCRITSFRRFWLYTGALVALCGLAGGLRTRFTSVTRRWIRAASCPAHGSFATRHGAGAILAPRRVTTVHRTHLCITILFFFGWPFARFTAKYSRWIVALPSSNLFSTAARFVTRSETAPLAKFPVDWADFQKARLLIPIGAEAIAILAVLSRWRLFTSAISCLNTFAALLRTVTPYRPVSVTTIYSSLEIGVISTHNKTTKSHGKAKRWQKPSRTHDRSSRLLGFDNNQLKLWANDLIINFFETSAVLLKLYLFVYWWNVLCIIYTWHARLSFA